MGWSGPGCQRHRAARTRVGHACGVGISLPGWLEDACAFVRSARLRDGFVRFIGRGGPCLWGRQPGRGVRDHAARRGRRHGAMPYASIADDSEVVRNRPIKCCDGFHSISHYSPAAAIRGEEGRSDAPAIREILTGGATRTFAGTQKARANNRSCSRCARGSRYTRLRRLECDDVRTAASRTAPIMSHRGPQNVPTEIERDANGIGTPRTHSVARGGVVGKRGNTARRETCRPVDRASGRG